MVIGLLIFIALVLLIGGDNMLLLIGALLKMTFYIVCVILFIGLTVLAAKGA